MSTFYFAQSEKFAHQVTRYYQMLFGYGHTPGGPNLDVVHEFQSEFSISLESLMFLAFGVSCHYLRQDEGAFLSDPKEWNLNAGFFRNLTDSAKCDVPKMLAILGRSPDHFKEEIGDTEALDGFNFTTLWRYPILHLTPEVFAPLDLQFLEDSISSRLYWILHDKYLEKAAATHDSSIRRDAERSREALASEWGRRFEWYTNMVLERCVSNTSVRVSGDLKDKCGGADWVCEYPDGFLIFEITKSRLKYKTVLSQKFESIMAEVDEILFGTHKKNTRGKLQQIDDSIKTSEQNWRGRKQGPIIFPVLVMENAIPWFANIAERIRKKIVEKQTPGRPCTKISNH